MPAVPAMRLGTVGSVPRFEGQTRPNRGRSMFSRSDLDELVAMDARPAVSIYLPTHIAGREIRQDPIRLENLLSSAADRPAATWRRPEIEDFLGLAVFLAPGFNHIHKLPIPVPEESFLGDHFHFKPLLPLLEDAGSFWLLTISANHTRLYPRVPDSQGRIARILHRVVPPVEPLIKRSPAPVIVAAPPEVQVHFREIAGWRGIQSDGITENPDALSEAELHRGAYALVEPKLAEARAAAVDRLNALLPAGKATTKPEEIVKAARYDTPFLTGDDHLWGWFDESEDRVAAHGSAADGDIDILDFAALMTLRQGGSVMLVAREALPPPGLSAAILRY
jgi:hypothetical protein